MGHSVSFINTSNGWANGLPLGNGCFGGMASYTGRALCFDFNHYDVYYRGLEMHSRHFEKSRRYGNIHYRNEKTYNTLEKIAAEHLQMPGEPMDNYADALYGITGGYGRTNPGNSYPKTGSVRLLFDGMCDFEESLLQLQVEDARVVFEAETKQGKLSASQYIDPSKAAWVCTVRREGMQGLSEIELGIPSQRGWAPHGFTALQGTDSRFSYIARFYAPGDEAVGEKPFCFGVSLQLLGARGRLQQRGSLLSIKLLEEPEEYTIVVSVFPKAADMDTGTGASSQWLADSRKRHTAYWQNFWAAGNVSLPDTFLETLWYVNLYTLDCCCGRGAKLYQQACGLNGLWDVHAPTLWGSMWYWDVNIQSAFAPLLTAGHVEIADAFCDALLSYTDLAEAFARDIYKAGGWAFDFPHALFNCIGPWCAQMLWWRYEYTGDEAFLREKAFPLFLKLVAFLPAIAKRDEETGQYYFRPDISPEQGPISANSVITLASVKYLLRFTLQAAEILGMQQEVPAHCREILEHFPDYPLTEGGDRWLDSEDAPKDLWLRHPSILMPVYPIGEVTATAGERPLSAVLNTLRYAQNNTERGVFGFGWLACAAARLGRGSDALRILCHKGIDLMATSNGLGHEETNRFINYCLLTKRAFYHPPMMEFSGGVVATMNEMLLQSFDGILHPFPAVPDGERDERAAAHNLPDETERFPREAKWSDAGFDNLRAKGGFTVSGRLENGKLSRLYVKSLLGNTVRVRGIPAGYSVRQKSAGAWVSHPFALCEGLYSFTTQTQGEYLICPEEDRPSVELLPWQPGYPAEVLQREAFNHHRIFLGENEHTAVLKALDSFVHPYQLGDVAVDKMGVYKFDFGFASGPTKKAYDEILHRPVATSQKNIALGETFIGVSPKDIFTGEKGYGFTTADNATATACCNTPLLDDCISGSLDTDFLVELPRGRYDLLFLLGGIEGESLTRLTLPQYGTRAPGRPCKQGCFVPVLLPVSHTEEEPLRILLSTDKNHCWGVAALMVNKLGLYM